MSSSQQLFPLASLCALVALTLSACDFGDIGTGERGSGNLVTEVRDLSAFTSVDASSAVNLSIVVDPDADQTVTVTYDDNILDNLITRVDGETLVVELDGNVNLTGNVDRLVAVVITNLDSISASGATNVTAEGSTDQLALDVSGASNVDLAALSVGDVELDASGASKVVLFVTGTATGSASGASDVTVRGTPSDVRIETSGASSLDLP